MPSFLKNDLGVFITVILFGFALYLVPLHNRSFYYNDYFAIVDNGAVKTTNIPEIFNDFNTRSLVGLSFALNYKWCGLHADGFRLVNLIIHCLNAFLVYLLIRYLWAGQGSGWPALFGSLLFLCHPVQTEPVNFITQRFVLMGSFFYLLTMVLYIQYRRLSQKRYLFAAMLSATAAMFCKEFTVTLPLMLGLYDLCFIPGDPLRKRCSRLLPFFIIALIVPLLLLRTPSHASRVAAIAEGHDITRARGGLDRREYFLTELNVMRTYVRLLLLPVSQNFDYDYPLSSAIDAKTAFSAAFLLGLLFIAWSAYEYNRLISFGILWFFIALSVESSFIPIGHVINEYRLYLASVGFIVIAVSVLYREGMDLQWSKMIATVILAAFCILTCQRNFAWKDELSLWNDAVKKSPHYAEVYSNRGAAYERQGNLDQALSDYNRSLGLNPNDADAYINRGVIYIDQENFPKAIADFSKAIALTPGSATAYNDRGLARENEGLLSQALSDYNKAAELDPELAKVYGNRGVIYAKLGQFARAIAELDMAIEKDPTFAEAYINRGLVYDKEGDYIRSLSDYNKAIGLAPRSVQAYGNRAIVYYKLKEFDKAWADVYKIEALGAAVDPVLIKALGQASEKGQ